MSCCRSWRRASPGLAWLLLTAAAQAAAAEPGEGGRAAVLVAERFVLSVSVDGVTADEPVLVRKAGGRIWMRTEDLRALQVRVEATEPEVALDAIPGLSFTLEVAAQSLTLWTVSNEVQRLRLRGRVFDGPTPITANGTGAIVNYDATAGVAAGSTTVAGSVDGVVYTPRGYAFAGAIASAADRPGSRRLVRLDAGFTASDPDRLLRATAGDFITAGTSFSRPVRMAGLKVGSDFSLRPDLVTTPVPAITGSAAVPSAVDVIVNGARRAVGEVRAGQFSVTDIPVTTGVNTVSVAVRDGLGRQTVQTVSTYVSRALLTPGLTAWSGEAGLVRTGYATERDRYRGAAISGTLRRGIDDRLTLEGHAEATDGVVVAGAGASLGLGALGLLDANLSVSRRDWNGDGAGAQLTVGLERTGRVFSLAARYTRVTNDWTDLASRYGAVIRGRSLVANVGMKLGLESTVGVSLIGLSRGWTVADAAGRAPTGPDRRYPATILLNGTYSVRLSRQANLIANLGTDLRRDQSTFASVGVLLVLGSRSSGYIGVSQRHREAGATTEYVRRAMQAGEFGYRASLAGGGVERVAAGAEYLGHQGRADVQLEHANGATAARLSARGALLVEGGRLHAADTTSNSFAVIDASGQAGLDVYQDNRLVGRTGRTGRLLVANLNPYQTTIFSFDPTQVGNDLSIGDTEVRVRPMERVGVPVRFAMTSTTAARVRLVDRTGAPLPAGSRARIDGADLPVGFDGEMYVTAVKPTNHVAVQLPLGRACLASFAAPAPETASAFIGPVVCRDTKTARN